MTAQFHAPPAIYLRMGEIAFSDQPATITTVLGSCVAVTLFDRRNGYGAMCHGVMPSCVSTRGCAGECPRRGHYVECSVLSMARRFRSSGVRMDDIEARVFGGAHLFDMPLPRKKALAVGRLNVEAAKRALSDNGIAVSAMVVGGRVGCRVSFDTLSGAVSVQRLNAAIGQAERMLP